MMLLTVHVKTSEESRIVQEHWFSEGYRWFIIGKKVLYPEAQFLSRWRDKYITYSRRSTDYEYISFEEFSERYLSKTFSSFYGKG